ncbi:MAG: hypothetical protein CMD26_05245 [Flavobacteriales bacterium]|nr:hypothetical protein [Flavobacteriales bacterium]|tara:strand:- start:14138 stop:15037 length:900 start_codon:yes stop_codon:yes gene_type:complete
MNIGIFGVGSFGQKHIHVLKSIKSFNIVGFFDPNIELSQTIENEFKIKSYKNKEELIKECDALDIVSETSTHYNLIKKIAHYNKHMFIEKPICSSKDESKSLIKELKNYKPIIQVGHVERYNPTIMDELQKISNIKTIESKRVGILNHRNKNTSITLDLMIHDIDLITQMTKSNIKKIQAFSDDKKKPLNHIECTLIFDNGTQAKLAVKRTTSSNSVRTMKIACEDKKVEIDLLKRKKKIITKNRQKTQQYSDNINPLKEELIDFYQKIKNQKKPLVGLTEACHAVNVAIDIEHKINQT